jgi:hypothetical protein
MSEDNMNTRLIPAKGSPRNQKEKISQGLVKILAWLPVYTAIIVTLTLLAIFLEWR